MENSSNIQDTEILTQLNTIVLDYFKLIGIEKCSESFLNDCRNCGLPVPEISQVDGLNLEASSDAEQILNCFDSFDGKNLLRLWTEFCSQIGVEDASGENNFIELTLFIRIFVASIPFDLDDLKSQQDALTALRKYLEENSELFTKHSSCLSFFAFPYVPNPKQHEVFKIVFTEQWRNELREKIEAELHKYIEHPKKNDHVHDLTRCDLYKMYQCYSQNAHLENENCSEIPGNRELNHKLSETVAQQQSKIIELEKRLTKSKNHQMNNNRRYYNLLQATIRIIETFRNKVKGNDYDEEELRNYLLQTLPDMFRESQGENDTDTETQFSEEVEDDIIEDEFANMRQNCDSSGEADTLESRCADSQSESDLDDFYSTDADGNNDNHGPDNNSNSTNTFLANGDLTHNFPKPPGTYSVSPNSADVPTPLHSTPKDNGIQDQGACINLLPVPNKQDNENESQTRTWTDAKYSRN